MGTAADVAKSARMIASNSAQLPNHYPKGTAQGSGAGNTRAKAAIWTDWAGFAGASAKGTQLAMELAIAITSEPGGMRAEYVDTLAAAQAEAGDIVAALTIQRQVVAALEQRGASPETLATYIEHLQFYEAGKPLRDP